MLGALLTFAVGLGGYYGFRAKVTPYRPAPSELSALPAQTENRPVPAQEPMRVRELVLEKLSVQG